MGFAHDSFYGVFLGIGIKTVRYRDLNETYYLYSSSDHVFFLATSGTLMLPKTGTLQIADHKGKASLCFREFIFWRSVKSAIRCAIEVPSPPHEIMHG